MKKMKLLPLLGAALLVLTGCNSSAGGDEISGKKAGSYYNSEVATLYSFDTENSKHHEEYTGVTDEVASEMMSHLSNVFAYLIAFSDNYYATPQEQFLDEYKVAEYTALAKIFDETMEYRLEGKKISASFTGSAHDQNYGFAMYFTATYHSYGLLKSSAYSLAVSHDKEGDGKVDNTAVFSGELNFVWSK